MFSSEFYEIFKNTFFTEHLLTTASELKKVSSGGVLSKYVLKNIAKFTEKHLGGISFLLQSQVGNRKLSEAATRDIH